MVISFSTLVLLGVVSIASAVVGGFLALLGIWVWYTVRLVERMDKRGSQYMADVDNEQAQKIRVARDAATGLLYIRQALHDLSPQAAAEFYQSVAPEPKKKGKK